MATQFASLTPIVRFPTPRQSVRIAYSSQSSLAAIADALSDQPTPVVEATLEELAITSQVQKVVRTAHRLLSPAMYAAFLPWMEDAYRFATFRSGGDEEAFRLCDAHADNCYCIAAMVPANEHDAAFQTYLYAIEASDSSCAGPLSNEIGTDNLVGALTGPFLDQVLASSELVTLLDTLAQQAWTFSSTNTFYDTAIGEAVIKVAVEARASDLRTVRPASMPSSYDPYMRGAWLLWQKNYSRFIEADRTAEAYYAEHIGPVVGTVSVDLWKQSDNNFSQRRDALFALIRTPAPGPNEIAIKLKLFCEAEGQEYDEAGDLLRCVLADARRFGRQGAYIRTDRALLAAIGQRVELEQTYPDGENDDEWERHARRVRANAALVIQPAVTIEGVLAKMRLAFTTDAVMAWAQHALTDASHPDFRKGLSESGGSEPLFWSAIEDLARLAGIDLGGPIVVPDASKHTAWLNERNDLLAAADHSEADVSDEEALSRINRLDNTILNTPATSTDDVIAKLVMAIEVQAEGANITSQEAVTLISEAKAHLGIGYVYSAEVAA